ncbi:undecaprenyldiphospho-muramoylpentapeptide beta-N-acetylglucosaminyltransferase [Pseudostreptobacillus hongkongensis]|uniref:undecaprenyldiphospho-muramoylpentapeptide beta-N-acetylglucosaminyltransferase n=1 Tax=Pseudostreptobacillus hongkongensis TaxID=1162717 RepID=UPI000835A1C2|nr:undecaprenyldiphospho-muramoylpentapeptide beta-N-acetylglucosaminyltransferase [Pseudostreptobacillus hongkongensis]
MKRILITTGGTGGHIYPALAVADKLKEEGHEVIFLGTNHRMEKDLVPANGYKFYGLDIIPIKSVKGMIKLVKAIYESKSILKKEKIDIVIGFGNYISLPALISAKSLKLKTYIQEQNVTMGQANKWIYPYVNKVFLAFPETLKSIPEKYQGKFKVTGNPLRKEFYNISKEEAREKLNIPKDKKVMCIMGGSLGAKNINDGIIANFDKFLNSDSILYWATGKTQYQECLDKVDEKENTIVVPYFEDSFNVMAASDLLLCRAGASTISEIIQLEKPSVLIPYNFVGQKENAEILEIINASKMYSNEEVTKAIDESLNILQDDDILKYMRDNINKINPGNAVENIANYINESNL